MYVDHATGGTVGAHKRAQVTLSKSCFSTGVMQDVVLLALSEALKGAQETLLIWLL